LPPTNLRQENPTDNEVPVFRKKGRGGGERARLVPGTKKKNIGTEKGPWRHKKKESTSGVKVGQKTAMCRRVPVFALRLGGGNSEGVTGLMGGATRTPAWFNIQKIGSNNRKGGGKQPSPAPGPSGPKKEGRELENRGFGRGDPTESQKTPNVRQSSRSSYGNYKQPQN